MAKQNKNLKNNGTELNIWAEDLLEVEINKIIDLENERLDNIGSGSR